MRRESIVRTIIGADLGNNSKEMADKVKELLKPRMFCTFTTDNHTSDVEVSKAGRYTISIAPTMLVGKVRKIDHSLEEMSERWMEQYAGQLEDVKKCHQTSIGLEEDGNVYQFDDVNDVVNKLEDLSSQGYRIPDIVYINLLEGTNAD